MYIAKFLVPGLFLLIVRIYRYSLLYSETQVMLSKVRVTVIHDHWNRYQLKANMDFLLVFHYNYMLIFYCLWDITFFGRIFPFFRRFHPPSLVWSFCNGLPWDPGYESWCLKARVPDGENRVILWGFVFTRYRPVTDRQTDRRTDGATFAKSRPGVAERDTKSTSAFYLPGFVKKGNKVCLLATLWEKQLFYLSS